jgi:hypothetical protein
VKKTLALATTLALAMLAPAHWRECRAQSAPPAASVLDDSTRGARPQSPAQPRSPTQTQTATLTADASKGDAGGRRDGSIRGRVVGEAGEPVPGVSVNIAPRGYVMMYSPQRAFTDDEGNFQLTGLDPGLYVLNAYAPGYVTDTESWAGGRPAYRPGDTATLRLVKGGVITGAVTGAQGEAVVGISVRAYRVRDLEGRPVLSGVQQDGTDDRGVYRIYGLPPGVYVVSAGSSGRGYFFGLGAAYDGNAPTFYPSATRDTASEVTVRAGQENAGVDIHYRDEPGHHVSGRIELPAGAGADPSTAYNVTLTYASMSTQADVVMLRPPAGAFSFDAVSDGDYDVRAMAGGARGLTASSAPQRISVRGSDVTDLRLTLAPLASVSGNLFIEKATEAERSRETCKQQRRPSALPQETLVTLLADRPAPPKGQAVSRNSLVREVTPEESGAFTLPALEPGRYRLAATSFDEALYVRSVQLPAASVSTPAPTRGAPAKTPAGAAPSPPVALDVRAGQQVSGVAVRLAEGAALLSGHVVVAEGSAPLPFSRMRVHLLPAERESADDPLRYFEATPDGSGAFTFKSLPPGRYMLVARPAPDPTPDAPARPAHWDADSRARLRREAEAANATVELQPCQRTTDFTLRLPK